MKTESLIRVTVEDGAETRTQTVLTFQGESAEANIKAVIKAAHDAVENKSEKQDRRKIGATVVVLGVREDAEQRLKDRFIKNASFDSVAQFAEEIGVRPPSVWNAWRTAQARDKDFACVIGVQFQIFND